MNTKKIWLVGVGDWGKNIHRTLEKVRMPHSIIDPIYNTTINNIDTKDPVILATPTETHFELGLELIRRGHDIFIEKPFTQTLDECKQLHDTAKNQILMVGYTFLYNTHCNMIYDIIRKGTLGDIKLIHSERFNWGKHQTETTPLLNLSSHCISIIQYWMDTLILPSRAITYNLSNNPKSYDRIDINGKCGDTEIKIDSSWHHPEKKRSIIIIGSKGTLVWDDVLQTIIIKFNDKQDKIKHICVNTSLSPLEIELTHYLKCIQNRTTPKTGIFTAMSVAQTLDEIAHVTNPNH